MISEQPATHFLSNRRNHRTDGTGLAQSQYVALCTGVAQVRRPRSGVVIESVRPLAPWLTLGTIVMWVALFIFIDLAVGRALQLGAENIQLAPTPTSWYSVSKSSTAEATVQHSASTSIRR